MDGWLNQVAAMDAVVSIANTTIHGAGGLASDPVHGQPAIRLLD